MPHGADGYRNMNICIEGKLRDCLGQKKIHFIALESYSFLYLPENFHVRIYVRMLITMLTFEPRIGGNLGFLSLEE